MLIRKPNTQRDLFQAEGREVEKGERTANVECAGWGVGCVSLSRLWYPRAVGLFSSASSTSRGSWICLAKVGKNGLAVNRLGVKAWKNSALILQTGTKTPGFALSPQTHLEFSGHYRVTVLKGWATVLWDVVSCSSLGVCSSRNTSLSWVRHQGATVRFRDRTQPYSCRNKWKQTSLKSYF